MPDEEPAAIETAELPSTLPFAASARLLHRTSAGVDRA